MLAGGTQQAVESQGTALYSPRRLGVRNSDLNHSEMPIAIYQTGYWRRAGVSKATGMWENRLA